MFVQACQEHVYPGCGPVDGRLVPVTFLISLQYLEFQVLPVHVCSSNRSYTPPVPTVQSNTNVGYQQREGESKKRLDAPNGNVLLQCLLH